MPIVNATIKAQINTLIEQTKGLEQKESQEAFCSGLANIIETSIKSATVTVSAGIPVAVVVPAGTGATTGPGTGTLS